MRILAIIALILAFAQPVRSELEDEVLLANGYFLDNSLSMGRRTASGSDLLSEAISLNSALVALQENSTSIAFTTSDFDQYHRPIVKKKLLDQLTEVTLSNHSVKLDQVQARLSRIDPNLNKLILLSDFQKTSFGKLSDVFDDTTISFHLYKIKAENETNLFVDSVILDNPIGLPTQNSIGVRINSVGGQPAEDVLLKLLQNGSQLASFTKSFPANEATWVNVLLPANRSLTGQYELVIEDNAYVFDNTYYFVIDDFKKPLVYQIYNSRFNESIKAVYSNEVYFDLKTVQVGKAVAADMLKSDLIVLDHLNEIPAWLVNQLREYAGSVITFPGEDLDLDGISQLVSSKIIERIDTSQYELSTKSLQHPFFESVFYKKGEKSNMPWIKPMYDIKRPSEQILSTSSNITALGRYDENRFVFASPLTSRYTNFHKHGLFLPLMYKISMASRNSPALAYKIDDKLVILNGDSTLASGSIKLHGEGGVLVPSVYIRNGRMILEIPSLLENPGFYNLVMGTDTLRTLAFNLPPEESQLKVISDEELQILISGRDHVHFNAIEDVQSFSEQITSEKEGVPLWKYALLLALIFLVAELTMLRLFR